ncbi:TPA: hypothetical protein ACH9VN_004260, partial [Escherichia coli]
MKYVLYLRDFYRLIDAQFWAGSAQPNSPELIADIYPFVGLSNNKRVNSGLSLHPFLANLLT